MAHGLHGFAMRLRSICAGVASGCCFIGIMAIAWTFYAQVTMERLSDANRASNSFGNEVKRNSGKSTSISECFKSSNSIYGWFLSFNKILLTSFGAAKTELLDGTQGKRPWATDGTVGGSSTGRPNTQTFKDDLRNKIQKESTQNVKRRGRDMSEVDTQLRRKKAVRRNVFVSSDELRYMNLATPNPKMEITIEVVDHEYDDDEDDDDTDDDWVSQPLNEEQVKPSRREEDGGFADRHVADISTEMSTKTPRTNSSGDDDSDDAIDDVLSTVLSILDPDDLQVDSCTAWMSCKSEKLMSHLERLNDLPGCPCLRPSNLNQDDAIFDEDKQAVFRWAHMDLDEDWLEIYKPTASHCIQSLYSSSSTSLAAQQCCYDGRDRLITRGPGAGTPRLVSTEISPELSYKIDVMPWIICKGDWTRYNLIRPPNNALNCEVNPDEELFVQYLLEARNF